MKYIKCKVLFKKLTKYFQQPHQNLPIITLIFVNLGSHSYLHTTSVTICIAVQVENV